MTSILSDTMVNASGLRGDAIPITARVTALADVFDALKSRRCYKEPWPEDKVLSIIREESGRHFDPEVVEAFFQIFDVIKAIDRKIQE